MFGRGIRGVLEVVSGPFEVGEVRSCAGGKGHEQGLSARAVNGAAALPGRPLRSVG